ncbi:MAG: S8 family peptidase [Crocinitomicaceae bacterium]|nr:S8 family peptidase [Crocinitomicaceae bacterium]
MLKKIILCFFLFQCSFFLNSQAILDANNRVEIEKISNTKDSILLSKYPIHSFNGENCLSMLCKASILKLEELKSMGYYLGSTRTNITSIRIPMDQLYKIHSTDFNGVYLEIAQKIKPTLDKAILDMHVDSVYAGTNLPNGQGYTGKNVYIGVTDWGFDYTSPVFYDTSLAQTRIVAAWDQYKTSGPSPSVFPYGTEYDTASELLAAECDTSNIYSYATHGTHVSNIAGGSGAGTSYRGVAFESNFLFVTFLINTAAVLDAWEWMYQKALADGKRLVINMSWGLYHVGTLDGTSLLSQSIFAYTDLDVLFVNSGGNNGNANFHLKKDFNNDTLRSKINFYSYNSHPYMWGQSVHAWGDQWGNSFENGIQVTNTSNSLLTESPYYSTATTLSYIDTFLVTGNDTIWYNISADSAHPLNGRAQMRLRVKNTNTSLRVVLKSRSNTGEVHYWNVTELSNDVGNWGMPFSYVGGNSLSGDSDYGISEPSCSDDVISVAAYNSQYTTAGGSVVGGQIASFSSKGPRIDGLMKPDISAPGVAVASAISSFTDNSYTSVGSIPFNGRTYHFAKFSGTSMASPMVAGVAALILEANPALSARTVKEVLKQTSRQDNYTGNISWPGDAQWGYGKVNAYKAVFESFNVWGLSEQNAPISWNIYPNPASDYISLINLPSSFDSSVQVLSIHGKLLKKINSKSNISIKNLQSGVYWIKINNDSKVQMKRFIKI